MFLLSCDHDYASFAYVLPKDERNLWKKIVMEPPRLDAKADPRGAIRSQACQLSQEPLSEKNEKEKVYAKGEEKLGLKPTASKCFVCFLFKKNNAIKNLLRGPCHGNPNVILP